MNILLIEDHIAISKALSKFLKINNINCIVANDGKNGLAQIKSNKWDAILLDLALPDFSGMDIINELENTGEIKDKNIIVYTASIFDHELKESILAKGVKDILLKPADPDIIVSTLRKVVGHG